MNWKMLLSSMILLLFMLLISCSRNSDSVNGPDSTNPPADHTISKDRVRHKPGLSNASQNCISCHGQDLSGGSVGVSCYSCHGKKWN